MALVSVGFTLRVTLKDSGNDTAVKAFALQDTVYADAVTASGVIIAALDAITTATISTYSLTEKYDEDAFTFPTAVEIENQAQIEVRLSTPNEFGTIWIPAPLASIFIAPSGDGYNIVDGTDTLVANYLALYNENAQAYISDGEFITPTVAQRFVSGKRIHKASKNG